jgi:FMN reductase
VRQRKLAIVSGGLAEPSSTRLLADRLATAADRALEELDVEAEVGVLELRDHAHGVTNMLPPVSPTSVSALPSRMSSSPMGSLL